MKNFIALLLVPALAVAANGQSLDLNKVVSQQKQIRSELMASNNYRELSEAQRTEILSRQDFLFRMFEGKQTADDLTADERASAVSQLEWIDGALSDGQQERKICRQEKKLGSNRPTRVCRTAAQIEREREMAQQQMGNIGSGSTDR